MNSEEHGVEIALAWPGLELIFFTAARILLCFGFVTKPALITGVLELFRAALTPCQGLLWLSGCTASKEAGLGGGRPRTADPSWPKGCPVPHGIMISSKTGKNWLGGLLLLRDWLGISWLVASKCILHHFFLLLLLFLFFVCLLVFVCFPFLLNCPSQRTSSHIFTFFSSSPIPLKREASKHLFGT